MKLRLNFLLPDLNAANEAFDALLLARVHDKDICFLAKPTTSLGRLPHVSAIEGTNSINEGGRGILYGAMFGLFCGLFVLYFPLWITHSPAWYTNASWWIILLVTSSLGALVVGLGAAMLGVNVFNNDLKIFKRKIETGSVLMIVSAPHNQVKIIRHTISQLRSKF